MKLKEIILKKKIPLYLNPKYSDLFFHILSNIKELKIEESKKKKKISLFDFEKKSSKQLTKNTIYKYFYEIDKAINKKESYNNEIYSQLELSYLKKKAKKYYKKLNLISIELRKQIDYIIKYYIGFCKYEIKKLHRNLFLIPSRTETMKSIFRRDSRIKTNFNRNISRKSTFKIFEKENEENQNDFLFDEEEEEEKRNINLFIGKFDIKKIMNNQQKIELKKGGFVNAFIFKNLINNDENDNKLFNFIKNSKKKYNKVISPIKTYRENSVKKFHHHLKLNNTLTKEESSYEQSSKNLFQRKKKKNLIFTTSYNNLYLSKHSLHFNKSKKLNLSPNSFISNHEKSIRISTYENKSLEKSFKKFPKLNERINSNSNSHSKNKRNSNILNYLSKKDLYY